MRETRMFGNARWRCCMHRSRPRSTCRYLAIHVFDADIEGLALQIAASSVRPHRHSVRARMHHDAVTAAWSRRIPTDRGSGKPRAWPLQRSASFDLHFRHSFDKGRLAPRDGTCVIAGSVPPPSARERLLVRLPARVTICTARSRAACLRSRLIATTERALAAWLRPGFP